LVKVVVGNAAYFDGSPDISSKMLDRFAEQKTGHLRKIEKADFCEAHSEAVNGDPEGGLMDYGHASVK
jgi:hypothetical protein